jgi:molecular chaperone GrpE
MSKDRNETEANEKPDLFRDGHDEEEISFKVNDRRHWARDRNDDQDDDDEQVSTHPTLLDEYKQRAETAESKLHEYIEAFKETRAEQDAVRERLSRDVKRRVELKFGELIADLLGSVDDLDRALAHVEGIAEARPLAEGVTLARDRFLAALERHGVEKIEADGIEFNPEIAEAVRMDAVDDPDLDGRVTETLQPGFRLGNHVIRAARVAVGRSR